MLSFFLKQSIFPHKKVATYKLGLHGLLTRISYLDRLLIISLMITKQMYSALPLFYGSCQLQRYALVLNATCITAEPFEQKYFVY